MEAHEDGIARFRRETGTGGRPYHPNSHQQRGLRFSGHVALHDLVYEAGAGVNSWFCAEGCDGVREDVAARVLA